MWSVDSAGEWGRTHRWVLIGTESNACSLVPVSNVIFFFWYPDGISGQYKVRIQYKGGMREGGTQKGGWHITEELNK